MTISLLLITYSNFVSNTNLWVGDIIGKTGDEHYKQWTKDRVFTLLL